MAAAVIFTFWYKPPISLPARVAALPFNVAAFVVISLLHRPVPAEHREKYEAVWAEEGVWRCFRKKGPLIG